MALELRGVTIRIGSLLLVDSLNASVGPGEVLAVMGASGCGKSSLLAWMAGTLEMPPFHAQGALWLDGRELTGLPIQQRRVGLLFQDDLLFPHMTVCENLLFALPAGPRRERVAAAEAALASAGLAGFGGRLPQSLSGGQRARVSLLRALLAGPSALLLDEPFSKLDAALRVQLRAFTFSLLREHQVPAVLVTHDVDDIPESASVIRLGA